MLIRSINGETPEGAVPVEDRGLTQKLTYSQLTTMCRLGWLRRHLGRDPSSKILFIEFYCNVPDGQSEAIQYEVLYK